MKLNPCGFPKGTVNKSKIKRKFTQDRKGRLVIRSTHLGCALLILAACSQSEKTYRVGDAPLVRKVFEDALTLEGIPYSPKSDGRYVTPSTYIYRMEMIGAESIRRTRNSVFLSVGGDCEANRIRTLLNDQHVSFTEEGVPPKRFFHVIKEDADRLDLVKQRAAYTDECWVAERSAKRAERERMQREKGNE